MSAKKYSFTSLTGPTRVAEPEVLPEDEAKLAKYLVAVEEEAEVAAEVPKEPPPKSSSAEESIVEAFKRHDTDGSGTISKDDLCRLLKSLGGNFSDADIDVVFLAMDSNKDGQIQYSEFVNWAFQGSSPAAPAASGAPDLNKRIQAALVEARETQGSIGQCMEELGIDIALDGNEPDLTDVISGLSFLSAKQLRAFFESADVDQSGHLQLSELQAALFPHATTSSQSAVTVAKVFAQMDKNKDGKVMCGEFVAYLLQRKKRITLTASDADKRQIAAAFGNADGDADGNVTLEELQSLLRCETEEEKEIARSCFLSLDRDCNGELSAAEFGRLFGKELLQVARGVEVQWSAVPDEPDSGDDT
mmetsp:Transcript_95744/g.298142  ORF Transcript_95744/g.298142 Transcript_95744/m.298142 type:complete len:361 (-) Transcript_95744:2-1084(-)